MEQLVAAEPKNNVLVDYFINLLEEELSFHRFFGTLVFNLLPIPPHYKSEYEQLTGEVEQYLHFCETGGSNNQEEFVEESFSLYNKLIRYYETIELELDVLDFYN